MKRFIIAFISIILLASSTNKSDKDKYVTYLNYDKLEKKYSQNKYVDKNTLFTNPDDSISHPRILIINSKKYYIIEGDLLLNEYELTQYKLSKLVKYESTIQEAKIVGEIRDHKVVKWPNNYTIKYSIIKSSFQTLEQYNIVRNNLKEAIDNWEKTCNINFFYDEVNDNNNTLTQTHDLTFIVAGFESNSNFIAVSFFPYTPPSERRLLIDPSYFATNIDKVGILRHEIGHIMGFRHEHIRNEAPIECPKEETNGTINITQYDSKSVMHYFCGSMGSIKLEITEIDRNGSQEIYGSPIYK